MAKKRRRRRKQDIDPREAIKARLVEIGRTRHWLSKQQTIVHETTARTYLYGRKDTTGDVIGHFMKIIGLEFKPVDE